MSGIAQVTDVANAFSTTLTAGISATDTTITVDSTGDLTAPCYLIIEPLSGTKREVVLCDSNVTATTFVLSGVSKRGLDAPAVSHLAGAKVISGPVAQHIDDLNARVDDVDRHLTVGATEPPTPQTGDLWVDTTAVGGTYTGDFDFTGDVDIQGTLGNVAAVSGDIPSHDGTSFKPKSLAELDLQTVTAANDAYGQLAAENAWTQKQSITRNVTDADLPFTTEYRPLSVRSENRVTDAGLSGFTSTVHGIRSSIQQGSASVDAKGTVLAFNASVEVLGSGSSDNEFSAYLGVVRVGTAAKPAAAGRTWLCDFGVHGPIGAQTNLLTGVTMFMNSYYATPPVAGPACGFIAVTKKGTGPASAGTDHAVADTYPNDIGLAIVGKSNASGTDDRGWRTGIQIGGYASGWMTSGESSIIGTGIDVSEYRDYGLYIHDREASGTGPAARFGGNVDMDNAKIIRGRHTDGTTRVSLAFLNGSNEVVFGDKGYDGYIDANILRVRTGATPTTRLTVGSSGLTFADGFALAVGSTTGTQIASAGTQKLGFWGQTPIVRPTGWGVPTGTATRTTFATSTVTVEQLAERVKALIDDLRQTSGMGLIGA